MRLNLRLMTGLVGLSLFLSACGDGGGDSATTPARVTELPATVSITGVAAADVDAPAAFTTNIAGRTTGLKFAWAFGDGATSTDAAPTHAYAVGGVYTVTLSVTNEVGVTRTSSFDVTASRTAMVKGTVCSGADQSGWCWQRPKPSGASIADVFFIDASNGWAVGDAGQILKTSDGGATWIGQRSNVTARLWQIRFANASTGWAVGDYGTVVKTTDGGTTWVAQASGVAYPYAYGVWTLYVVDAARAVMSGDYGVARTTIDGGEHWNASVLSVPVVTPNGTMWSFNSGVDVRKSTDAGVTSTSSLTIAPGTQVNGLSFADDAHGWAYGYNYSSYPSTALLWRTADGGSTWESIAPAGLPDSSSIQGLRFTSASVGWVSTFDAPYRSTDGGATWAPLTLPDGAGYYYGAALTALDDATAWYGWNNGVYLTRDGGATWVYLKVDAESASYYGTPRLQINGSVSWLHFAQRSYRSTDNGATWQLVFGQESQDQNGNLLTTWFFDGKKGLAYSSAGWIVETADGGQTWTRKTLSTASGYGPTRMQFASATTGWLQVSGSFGGSTDSISASTDGGTSWWVPLSPVDFGGLADFHFFDAQLGWSVGSSGAINHSTDGGHTWTRQIALPYRLTGVRFASATVGVAVGAGGIIARTADAGATWTLRPSGVPRDLARVSFVDALTGWAVGSAGTVVKTTDGGVTWTRVAVPSSADLNDVVFLDARLGWIVGGSGTVLVTTDGGLTWRAQASGTDKSLFGAFFIDPRSGWLVGAGGTILATATGGD